MTPPHTQHNTHIPLLELPPAGLVQGTHGLGQVAVRGRVAEVEVWGGIVGEDPGEDGVLVLVFWGVWRCTAHYWLSDKIRAQTQGMGRAHIVHTHLGEVVEGAARHRVERHEVVVAVFF